VKRTREVTAIHYRRSIKQPSSLVLHSPCPVCRTPLEVIVLNEVGETQSVGGKAGSKVAFRVVRGESPEHSNRPSKASPQG